MSLVHTLRAITALYIASAAITAGATAYDIPFTDDFGPHNHLSDFVIIDANADGEKWHLNTTWNIFGGDRSLEEMRMTTYSAADDWLLTPSLHLEAGMTYAIAFDVHCGDYRYPETMEVWLGNDATVTAMTTEVMPAFNIANYSYEGYSKEFAVEATGEYRLGLHAISPAGSSDIFVDNLSVKLSVLPEAPAAVSALTVTPDATGARSVELTFIAPSATVAGQPLSSLTRIDILRNRQVIGSIQQPEVGALLSYTDKSAPNGMNSYSVIAYNNAGKGLRADAEAVYVGVDVPQAPVGARIVDNGQSITISWEPVGTVGSHGMVVDPSRVIYSVSEYDFAGDVGNRLYYGNETSVTLPFNSSVGMPDMAKWAIKAHSDAGESDVTTVRMSVGRSYRLPYAEGFSQGTRRTLIWTEQSGYRSFNISTEACADGDGGSILFVPYADGDESTFCLGRISLLGAANPMLTFSYRMPTDATIQLLAWTADGRESLLTTLCGDTIQEAEADWQVAMVPLSSLCAQPYVVLKFRASGMSGAAIFVDALRVGDLYSTDLDVALTAPAAVNAGDEIGVSVRIVNVGSEAVTDYMLQLSAQGGDEHYEAPVVTRHSPLLPFASETHIINIPTHRFKTDRVTLSAKVWATGDLQPGNNTASALVGIEGAAAIQQICEDNDSRTFDLYTIDGRLLRRGAKRWDDTNQRILIIKK